MNAVEMSKNGYLLLFHSNNWWQDLGRENLEKIVAQNNAWIERLMTAGKAKGGQALTHTGAMVSGKNGQIISDGPFAESKEVIGGYLLLNVETFAEATAVARTSPSLAYGAKVEVRPLTDACPLDARLQELARADEIAVA